MWAPPGSLRQHPLLGPRATTRLVSSRFVWPGLAMDVLEWCRECVAYQRPKVTTQPSTPVEKIGIPEQRFSHMHMDLVGLCLSRLPSVLSRLPSVRSRLPSVLSGLPAHMTTDRGAQFTSGTWTTWCKEMQVEHITTKGHSTIRPTARWSGCTVSSRTPYMSGVLLLPGWTTYLGSSWDCV